MTNFIIHPWQNPITNAKSLMTSPKITATRMLFLCRAWSRMPRENIAVWWCDVCIIVLDCFCDFKPKFLIKVYGIFIVCLHMQINLRNVYLGAKIKNMIQQPCSCINPQDSHHKCCLNQI